MAWYRTYRPQTVSELAITPVREQLEKILKSGKFAHAYLFAGSKGTGKTSTARILARILNEPKNADKVLAGKGPLQEPTSDDPVLRRIAQGKSQVVIEQDAASHRGIDDIRQLQEQVSIVPTEGLVRVVILDEVHMLTTEAFNALLKLLEEPPERVVFVLATTELHKVPATVQSRCQMIRFRQANADEIQQVLQRIAQEEGVKLSDEQAAKLAEVSQGSFRDAVKNFESVVQDGSVDAELAQNLFAGNSQSAELLKALAGKKLEEVSQFFQTARQNGSNFAVLEQELFSQLQQRLHRAIERKEATSTIRHICDLTIHLVNGVGGFEPIEGIKLELACLDWCLSEAPSGTSSAQASGSNGNGEKTIVLEKKKAEPIKHNLAIEAKEEQEVPLVSQPAKKLATGTLSRQQVEQEWSQFLFRVRTESQALESLLRNSALGDVQESTIEIQVDLPFHKEKIESQKYSSTLRKLLEEKFAPGTDFRVTLFQKPEANDQSTQEKRTAENDQLLAAVEAAVLSLEGSGTDLIYSEQQPTHSETVAAQN
jgi:DNA polymerase III subunit gamma/tau